jgi:hypothetical protein
MGQIAQDTINKPLIHLHEGWCPHYETAVGPTLPLNIELYNANESQPRPALHGEQGKLLLSVACSPLREPLSSKALRTK